VDLTNNQELDPALPEEPTLYKLIHIGKPHVDYINRGYEIPCYFQPWVLHSNCAASDNILCHSLNSTFAGEIICGTLWEKAGGLDKKEYILPTDYHTFTIESETLYAHHLSQVVEVQFLTLPKFWMQHEDTWVICLKSGNKRVLIPYFELARVLFYQTSRRLTDFILSQTPTQFLCRPLVAPAAHNDFTARFCVTATNLTAPEARLLGNLLFDPEVGHAFNVARAYWLTNASTSQELLLEKRGAIAVGNFSNLSFNASGYNFSYDEEDFFWVNQLEISRYDYVFDKLLFYPLSNKQETESLITNDNYPTYSDLLQLLRSPVSKPAMKCCSLETSLKKPANVSVVTSSKKKRQIIQQTGALPLVVRRPTWAAASSGFNNVSFIDDVYFKNLGHHLPFNSFSHSAAFSRLIREFAEFGHTVRLLAFNNPNQVFGNHLSILPINDYAPLPGSIYSRQLRYFSFAEITLTNALIYIAQPFPETNPELMLLIVKQSLTEPSELELSSLLSNIIPIYNSSDLRLFYSRAKSEVSSSTSDNTSLLAIPLPSSVVKAKFCLHLVEHIASRFKRRLAIFLAMSLRYPKGLTARQLATAHLIGHDRCKAPDGNWLVLIHDYWSRRTWRRT
jgi:hypothetical protein